MEKVRARIIIEGRVQGVFFRAAARQQANLLNLYGWVKNLHNGNVESIVEGEKSKADEYIKWCHKGSASAKVTNVTTTWNEYKGEFQNFSIK